MQVFAPAKINLSLKILNRREDGFHEIETLIAPITLCDEITVGKRDSSSGIEFHCDFSFSNQPRYAKDAANRSRR